MPRGVPRNGFRMTKNRIAALGRAEPVSNAVMIIGQETEQQVEEKLALRFAALETMAAATIDAKNVSLIVSGPSGVGKSYSIEQMLQSAPRSTMVKGFVRPTGLYKTLYEYRDPGCVVVFDDADSIFQDDVALNLLKAACDTTDRRVLHWLTETRMEDEDGDRMPRSFEFQGSIVFITNYDFDELIRRGSKLAPHLEAMISRSHYIDLAMKTTLDYIVRIKQVLRNGMLQKQGFTKDEELILIKFIEENQTKLRELSLRMVLKLANLMRIDDMHWKDLARTTAFR